MQVCKKCSSTDIKYQVSQVEVKAKKSIIWWLLIGWWLKPLMWVFLTIPMLILSVFGVGKKTKNINKSFAVCQRCGYTKKVGK